MVSKRQILDVCNKLFMGDRERYLYCGGTKAFNSTVMANDLIFQLALEDTADYEMILKGVHEWWSESTYNPGPKKFKS